MCCSGLGEVDLVVVEKEAFPFVWGSVERWFLRGAARIILDYDDAVWVSYEGRMGLADKLSGLMADADAVLAGSSVIRDYASNFNPRVRFVPTVVDPLKYRVKSAASGGFGPVKIGWVGTPITAQFLPRLANVLRRLAARRPVVFVNIGGGEDVRFPGVLVRSVPWTLASEAETIENLDIGIMPLRDDAFARGKCGYKLIQYMAAGLPTVASDVGENRHIVIDGVTGYLARTDEEWESALVRLCDSPELRRTMGLEGRRRVEERYSLPVALNQLVSVFEEVLALPPRRDRLAT